MKKSEPIMNKWGVMHLNLDTLSNQHLRELYAGLLQETERVRRHIVARQAPLMDKPGKYDPVPKDYIPSTVRPTGGMGWSKLDPLTKWSIIAASAIIVTVLALLAAVIVAGILR